MIMVRGLERLHRCSTRGRARGTSESHVGDGRLEKFAPLVHHFQLGTLL
jgi:hypothetical protein